MPGALLFSSSAARFAGGVLSGLGVVLMLAAFASIRRAIQIAPEPRPGSELVTTGVYKTFRHPIYTAIIVLVIGLFLRRPTIAVALAAIVVIVFLVIKVRFEEELLQARYPSYPAYKSRTVGVIPWRRG